MFPILPPGSYRCPFRAAVIYSVLVCLEAAMCECISNVDGFLKDRNAFVNFNMLDKSPKAFVLLEKVDVKKRGKVPLMQATYCPFCGVKYA